MQAYGVEEVRAFAAGLLIAAGMDGDKATVTARLLVDADMMGRPTHGIALCARYAGALAAGTMAPAGQPLELTRRGACVVWDGNCLPGPWLVARAIDAATELVAAHGVATIAIRRSDHIGCLAVLLRIATERGFVVEIMSSNPAQAHVAPFGGRTPVYSTNPFGFGYPTSGDPVLIDFSTTIASGSTVGRYAREGRTTPSPWVLDPQGTATTDARVFNEAGASLLPIGGLDHGHKGFALGLMVEMQSQGLAGWGRAEHPSGSVMSVFVRLTDPEAFAGSAAFLNEADTLAALCRASETRTGVDRVRLAGERAMASWRKAQAGGVLLDESVLALLAPLAERFSIPIPEGTASHV
jgi:L-lactate dehydrogenase